MRSKIRRVVAPIAFLGALGLLASQTCKSEMAQTTIVVEVGADTTEVSLELLEINGSERQGFFRGKPAGEPRSVRWKLAADAGDYDLSITHGKGGAKHERRRVSLVDRATLTITMDAH